MSNLEMALWLSVGGFSMIFGVCASCGAVFYFYHNPYIFLGTVIGLVFFLLIFHSGPRILKALEALENGYTHTEE